MFQKRGFKKSITFKCNIKIKAHQMYCPDCGEDPCVCKEDHPNSYYSDPPDEHKFQGDVVRDYDDYDGDCSYPDPDDDEVFF